MNVYIVRQHWKNIPVETISWINIRTTWTITVRGRLVDVLWKGREQGEFLEDLFCILISLNGPTQFLFKILMSPFTTKIIQNCFLFIWHASKMIDCFFRAKGQIFFVVLCNKCLTFISYLLKRQTFLSEILPAPYMTKN